MSTIQNVCASGISNLTMSHFHMKTVWSRVMTVSTRPFCHVVTKKPFRWGWTLHVMGLAVETQAIDVFSEKGSVWSTSPRLHPGCPSAYTSGAGPTYLDLVVPSSTDPSSDHQIDKSWLHDLSFSVVTDKHETIVDMFRAWGNLLLFQLLDHRLLFFTWTSAQQLSCTVQFTKNSLGWEAHSQDATQRWTLIPWY